MNETAFDKNIHNAFKDDLGNHLLKVSTNYVDFLYLLDSHLTATYGTEINRSQILDKYKNSTNEVSSIEDIEEVSQDFIRKMINTEDEYLLKVNRLHELNNILSDKKSVSDNENILLLQEAVELIGLNGNKNGILAEIIDNNCRFVENPKHFRSLNSALLMIIKDVSRLYTSGIQRTFPNTKSVAMMQTRGRCFYRGENAFYKSSKASCYRGLSLSDQDCVLWMLRLYECFHFFDSFNAVKQWNYSEVNYYALAQHYGFRTHLLDITTSLKTALFFACCKPDENGLDWHPLTEADFKKADSRKNVAALGGDSRYAILHYVPTNIVDCQWMTVNENETHGIITPIGYQPFMRCSAQYGYMMITDEKYDLMKDKLFRKIRFRLTEDFCNWIFNEMDCGRAIYPNDDDIARIQDIVYIVSEMNTRTEFSKYNAENVRKDISAILDPMFYYSTLKQYGITIKDKIELLSDKTVDEINNSYTIEKIESKMEFPKCSPLILFG